MKGMSRGIIGKYGKLANQQLSDGHTPSPPNAGESQERLATQLGNEDALRGLIYMKKDSVRIPPGVIASAHHLSIIKSIVRLRTRIVEAGAEKAVPEDNDGNDDRGDTDDHGDSDDVVGDKCCCELMAVAAA